MTCIPHRVPECPQCKERTMPGKCEHGLTTRECMVCASPKRGAKWVTIPSARLAQLEASERDALRFRWLAERTAATGLERWVHPFQFLCEAVDERMTADATMRD